MKKILDALVLFSFTVPIGFLVGLCFLLFRILGRIKVLHIERFPRWRRKLIVVSNHPSLLETVLVPALFFPEYSLNPFWYSPWSTPDKKNFFDRWYWFWARPISIPIDRGNKLEERKLFYKIKQALDRKKIVVLFAEGRRTFKAERFLYSKQGKRIGEFKNGIGWLVVRTGARVLPVWVEGTDKVLLNHPTKLYAGINWSERITIKIGQLMRFRSSRRLGSSEEITKKVTQALLELADEE